ncbi:hypothetical protein ABZ722_11575 [Streptomyces longwoodensis]|uniref:hypothetical protein n=1 Tax=Streptomyces longwoodensis TaxID=68231 RepID=UPI0033F76CFD
MTAATKTPAAGDTPGRPARPAGYWERVTRIVDQAPPLTDQQRALIRAAFHQPADRRTAA